MSEKTKHKAMCATPTVYQCRACKELETMYLMDDDSRPRRIGWYFYCSDCYREKRYGVVNWHSIMGTRYAAPPEEVGRVRSVYEGSENALY